MPARSTELETLLSELSLVELECGRLLDDESLRLVAEVRRLQLINDAEWKQIKGFLRDALAYLSVSKSADRDPQGRLVIDPDADPRNADWLRIDAACRLAHRALPLWAALWLWWLRTDVSRSFWRKVGVAAKSLGYPAFPPTKTNDKGPSHP